MAIELLSEKKSLRLALRSFSAIFDILTQTDIF